MPATPKAANKAEMIHLVARITPPNSSHVESTSAFPVRADVLNPRDNLL